MLVVALIQNQLDWWVIGTWPHTLSREFRFDKESDRVVCVYDTIDYNMKVIISEIKLKQHQSVFVF